MTNQQGTEVTLAGNGNIRLWSKILRYKIGYATDDWGMRSSTPSGIPDHAGAWVRYEDHIAAMVDAQQPAPSAAVALSDDLRGRLVAISAAIADQDDRAAQAMLREILAAPQPVEREPLTHAQAKALVLKYGNDPLHLVLQVERAHGIKGGQHGTE